MLDRFAVDFLAQTDVAHVRVRERGMRIAREDVMQRLHGPVEIVLHHLRP
ncbi:hypothetical protein [Gemmatimonas sp.]